MKEQIERMSSTLLVIQCDAMLFSISLCHDAELSSSKATSGLSTATIVDSLSSNKWFTDSAFCILHCIPVDFATRRRARVEHHACWVDTSRLDVVGTVPACHVARGEEKDPTLNGCMRARCKYSRSGQMPPWTGGSGRFVTGSLVSAGGYIWGFRRGFLYVGQMDRTG